MIAILVETQKHSQNVMSDALLSYGFRTVLRCDSQRTFLARLAQCKEKCTLVVVDEGLYPEIEEPLRRLAGESLRYAAIVLLRSAHALFPFRASPLHPFDEVISKPFAIPKLVHAVSIALHRKRSRRSEILYYCESSPAVPLLNEASRRSEGNISQHLLVARDLPHFKEIFNQHVDRIGSILVDCNSLDASKEQTDFLAWIKTFNFSPVSSHIILACFGTVERVPQPLRQSCQFYRENLPNRAVCEKFLRDLSLRVLSQGDNRLITQRLRTAATMSNYRSVIKLGKAFLQRRSFHPELLASVADALLKEGKVAHASKYYFRAIHLNPFFPHPYIKLMEINAGKPSGKKIEAMALKYCQSHPQILARTKEAVNS